MFLYIYAVNAAIATAVLLLILLLLFLYLFFYYYCYYLSHELFDSLHQIVVLDSIIIQASTNSLIIIIII